MKRKSKKITAITLAVLMMVGGVFVSSPKDVAYAYGSGGSAEGMEEKSMKDIKVQWDLKADKEIPISYVYAGVGKKKASVKITNYKVVNDKKKGYKKLTFTFNYTRKWTPTAKDVHKILNCDEIQQYQTMGGEYYYGIVDYKTGYDLEQHNDLKVKVKAGKWKSTGTKKYTDSDGCWVSLPKKSSCKVTVTYPKDYDGLCIFVSGSNSLDTYTYEDAAFWNGMYAFNATSLYIDGKKNSHWMRVK